MHRRLLIHIASALLALPLMTAPLLAAGDGGSGSDGANVPKCPTGKVWDKAKEKCVDATQGFLDDNSIYETGRDLALAGRYDEAIEMLTLATDKTDPRILNYLGYSHRKAGRIDVGLGYYEEALRQDPNYTLVREYLGEAHLQRGDVDAAKAQLAEIEKRCGKGCKEYAELATQIDAFVKG